MEIHHETGRRWAIMQTSFIVIRVAICRFTNAMNQFHEFRLNNDAASTIFGFDWFWTAQHAAITGLFIFTLAPWPWEIPFFTRCQTSDHIIVSAACSQIAQTAALIARALAQFYTTIGTRACALLIRFSL